MEAPILLPVLAEPVLRACRDENFLYTAMKSISDRLLAVLYCKCGAANLGRGRLLAGPSLLLFAILFLTACSARKPQSFEVIQSTIVKLLDAGKVDEALGQADRALARCSPERSPVWYWRFYIRRAELISRKKGPAAGLLLLEKEVPCGSDFTEIEGRRKLAQVAAYYALSDYSRANALLGEAAQIGRRARSKDLLARVALWRANVQSRVADWSGAESAVREAGQLAGELADADLQSRALTTLAFVFLQESQFEEAIRPLEHIVPILERRGENARLARALNNLGWSHYRLGDLGPALRYFQRAEALNAGIPDIGEQQACLGHIGNIYLDENDLSTARRYYERALDLARRQGDRFYTAKWLGNLARVSILSKDWTSAGRYNDEATRIKRSIHDRVGEIYSLRNSAFIARGKGLNDDAERIFQDVLQSNSQDPSPVLDAEAGLAELYAATDRAEWADRQFRASLVLVDSGRSHLIKDEYKLSYLSSLMEFYQSYVDFLMSQGRTQRALEVAEASRARILTERAGGKAAPGLGGSVRYKQLAASSGSVLLSYWLAPGRSFLWVITPQRIVSFTLPPESRIKTMVESYRAIIENFQNPLDSDDPSGRELYEALLAPARPLLPPGARVFVVPDGSLHALNFETLPVPGPNTHYWIEDATVSVAPSLNLIANTPPGQPGLKSLLLIGNPEQVDDRFPKLQYAPQEIASIQKRFAGSEVRSLVGKDAGPASYFDAHPERFSYLHFTSHATANRESPLDSAIILSRSGENYRLTARDILTQPLRADLVTISACRSAGAKTYAGEGLVGFTWTFFQAGAYNVIAGLWDVSDDSTPKIMDGLYAGIYQGQPIAGALRSAKLALMRENKSFNLPYYWGALQLYCRSR